MQKEQTKPHWIFSHGYFPHYLSNWYYKRNYFLVTHGNLTVLVGKIDMGSSSTEIRRISNFISPISISYKTFRWPDAVLWISGYFHINFIKYLDIYVLSPILLSNLFLFDHSLFLRTWLNSTTSACKLTFSRAFRLDGIYTLVGKITYKI